MTFTFDEIIRQPYTWEKTVEMVRNQKSDIKQFMEDVQPEEVIFIGCGTSYYISIAAAATFMEVTGITAKAVPASEVFLKPDAVINRKRRTLVVGSSRSGTTTEVVLALEYVKKHNLAKTIAVTTNPDSETAKHANYSIVLPHVQESSVVMTGSFTNILLALNLVASFVADDKHYETELSLLAEAGQEVLEHAKQIGRKIGENLESKHFIFLGLGAYYGLACEGMLKLKEMTQVFCEAFNPLEFRHGPISVLTGDCHVILLHQLALTDYETSLINDVRKYGATTTVIGDRVDRFQCDYPIALSKGFSDKTRNILYVPYLQLIAYYRTIEIGFNPDKPRNLTQVVKL